MENDRKEGSERPDNEKWWAPALVIFIKLSSWIVIPVILALFLGKWLDGKFGTEPWLLFISIAAAFVISMIGLGLNAKKELKSLNNGIKDKKDK